MREISTDTREVDVETMRRALELARATVGLASPNPMVGCVLVRGGELVGEGVHVYDDFDHAEIVALKQAEERARGAAAYVTLEPCSHHGRTGPCANALIAAGVRRVVAATLDPNPIVAGEGIARLRDAGVEVVVGVCEVEAREVNEAFARWSLTGRPLVTLKAALSADGMLAPEASERTEKQTYWITDAEARAEVQRMRHAADAVLTGLGTVLADDPALTDRSGLARRRPLLRVVLDSRLRTPLDSQLARSAGGDVLMVCDTEAETAQVEMFEEAGIDVARVPGVRGRLDLGAVLSLLGKRKILSVLLECGSELNAAFLAGGLVDKAALFYAQKELGRGAVPFAAGSGPPLLLEQSMTRVKRTVFGADTCVSGTLHDPWNGDELG